MIPSKWGALPNGIKTAPVRLYHDLLAQHHGTLLARKERV